MERQEAENYLNEFLRRIDLIASADINNPEALEMWNRVKDLDWIKPEIREKWEKVLKGVEIKKS